MPTSLTFPPFATDPDAVDPADVPHHTLPTGARIPALGLGTFGSDRYANDEIARAVFDAATLGSRHFDCASVYGNEAEIGMALRAIQTGVPATLPPATPNSKYRRSPRPDPRRRVPEMGHRTRPGSHSLLRQAPPLSQRSASRRQRAAFGGGHDRTGKN